MHVDCAQFLHVCYVLGACARDVCPKALRVVELKEVAQFVHNDVVREVWWKEDNAVVEIEVLLARATSPARALVAYGDSAIRTPVVRTPVREALMDERTRAFLVRAVVRVTAPAP